MGKMMRFLVPAEISTLGDDEVRVIMSTAALARDGHILMPQGCQLANYRKNPIVLWSHNADQPVGNAEDIAAGASQIAARVRFAPLGISPKADEIRGLTKAGVIRCTSISFDPITMKPRDPKNPRGGQVISVWELLEMSFVSIPSDTGAIVTARALREGEALDRGAETERRQRDVDRLTLAGEGHTIARDATFDRRQRQLAAAVLANRGDASFERRQREVAALRAPRRG